MHCVWALVPKQTNSALKCYLSRPKVAKKTHTGCLWGYFAMCDWGVVVNVWGMADLKAAWNLVAIVAMSVFSS